jgi:hypothetical protein
MMYRLPVGKHVIPRGAWRDLGMLQVDCTSQPRMKDALLLPATGLISLASTLRIIIRHSNIILLANFLSSHFFTYFPSSTPFPPTCQVCGSQSSNFFVYCIV